MAVALVPTHAGRGAHPVAHPVDAQFRPALAPEIRGRVGAELAAIADKEARMEQVVKSDAKYPAWLDDILKSDRVRIIDRG